MTLSKMVAVLYFCETFNNVVLIIGGALTDVRCRLLVFIPVCLNLYSGLF